MTSYSANSGLCLSAIVFGALCTFGCATQSETSTIELPERHLYQLLDSGKDPEYPRRATADGVAVAEVIVGVDGLVLKVTVVESPDPVISDALRTALSKWTFRTISAPGPAGELVQTQARGTLAFLFDSRTATVRRLGGAHGRSMLSQPNALGQPTGIESSDKAPATISSFLLDVRERKDFRHGHRSNALNIPLSELSGRLAEIGNRPIEIDCGPLTRLACDEAGVQVHSLTGMRPYLLERK